MLFAGSFIGDYTGMVLDSTGHAITVWTDFAATLESAPTRLTRIR